MKQKINQKVVRRQCQNELLHQHTVSGSLTICGIFQYKYLHEQDRIENRNLHKRNKEKVYFLGENTV